MTVDVVNSQNQKVGSVDLRDDVFGGRAKTDLIWESVVRQNASERRGTHATKNRALVSGSGKKPWRQKGTVFGPQPRSYDYQLPKKVEKAALRAAITQRLKDGDVVIVDALTVSEAKTKAAAAVLEGLGVTGKTLLLDVTPDAAFSLAARNLAGVRLVPTNRVTARDVMDSVKVVATRAAFERLQEVLA